MSDQATERKAFLDGKKMPALREIAKANDIAVPVGTKKDDLFEQLVEHDGPLAVPDGLVQETPSGETQGSGGDGQGDTGKPGKARQDAPQDNVSDQATERKVAYGGETRPVARTNANGDWWCPFCDHSQTDRVPVCQGCGAKLKDA